ncbi:MPG (predicted) [Pycnogonum litorale]
MRVGSNFFDVDCTVLARALLGKILVRTLDDGSRIRGRIVETECYLGVEDKASHSFNGKRTSRTEAMVMSPGTAYVYIIYGIHHCFNISSQGDGAAALIRSLEPIDGINVMQEYRRSRRKSDSKPLKNHELCNGPSKLCQAFNINKECFDRLNMCQSDLLYIEDDNQFQNAVVVTSKRIGIEGAGIESASKLLRFYVKDCKSVSIRDKQAEALFI